ncbi:hypothetical protein [Aquirufa nivalisilvae]
MFANRSLYISQRKAREGQNYSRSIGKIEFI